MSYTLFLFLTVSTSPELLSQLSGVRRSAGGQLNSSGPSASQLQQLQMQLQLERQQAQAARQQLETARNATRQRSNPSNISASIPPPSTATNTAMTESNPLASHSSQFLLTRYGSDIIIHSRLCIKEILLTSSVLLTSVISPHIERNLRYLAECQAALFQTSKCL